MVIPLTETQFQKQVTDLAESLGWKWLHIERMGDFRGQWRTPVSGPLGRGFPDLLLIRRGTVLFVELKAQGKYMTPMQQEVSRFLSFNGHRFHLWRPSDFPQVVEVLTDA